MADENATAPIIAALNAGKAEEAERFCRAALETNPDDARFLTLLALSLETQGRVSDALQLLARLVKLYPDESGHWRNYAGALHHLGKAGEAREAAVRAAELAPAEREDLERLGQLCVQLDAPQAAAIALQRAAELAPDSAKLQIDAARARVAAHDILAGEALRGWRKWPNPADESLLDLAELLAEVSEPWDALEILEALNARRPTDWSAQLLRA
jgi:Flp pilus assembly protein TadD